MIHQPTSVDQSDRIVPINLRQSGRTPVEMLISTRVRKSPYWHLSHEAGCWRATVYNRIYHPRGYVRPEDGGAAAEHEALTRHVTVWNVAVERQIRVRGPDAAAVHRLRDHAGCDPNRADARQIRHLSATRGAGFSTTRCCCAFPGTSSGSRWPTPTFCSGCKA